MNDSLKVALTGLLVLAIAGPGCAQQKRAAIAPAVAANAVPLGGGLNGEIDWSRDNAFVDMVKTSRGLISRGLNGSPPRKDDKGEGLPATLGPDGQPTEDFWMRIADTGAPVGAGVYKLSFRGSETVQIDTGVSGATLTKTGYDAATGKTTYDVAVLATATVLEFNFKNTQGKVKNPSVIRPGYEPAHPPLFTREYLSLIKARNPNLLRFMDWHSTNGNLERDWAERSLPTDLTQTTTLERAVHVGWSPTPVTFRNGKGICWEYCIALANAVHADVWLNVPILATDDYVRQLATLVKKDLDPSLNVYVEYSNEVWNDGFLQTGLNRDLAQAEVKAGATTLDFDKSTDAVTLGDRRVAKRLKEIGDIFGTVFGPGSLHTRIRPVLAYQLSAYRFQTQLTYINKVYGPPSQYFTAIAVAPYFACGNGQGADARKDLTKDDVLDALSADIDHYRDSTVLTDIATLAAGYGLKMFAYEGGPDTFGPNNIQAKKAATLNPRMKDLVIKYLNTWYSHGGDQFNWFVIGAGNFDSQYGTWSLTDNLADLSQPKELGFDAVRTSPRPAVTVGVLLPGEVPAQGHLGQAPPYPSSAVVRFIGADSQFDYLVRAPQAGAYQLRVSIANANTTPKSLDVLLNNKAVGTVSAAPTKGENTFADTPPLALTLNAGLNVIRLHVPDNRPYNLNSLKITRGADLTNTLPLTDFYAFGPEIKAGATYENLFNVTDGETSADKIIVTATSDDPTLLAVSGIAVSTGDFTDQYGGHHNRKLTLTPVAGQTGKANITLTLKDGGGLTRALGFTLTVK